MVPKVLITGASSGIGAIYADRFARRGHPLVLVARDVTRMEALATRLRAETGVAIDILPADLTRDDDIARVEARLRADHGIGILVNNAGAGLGGSFAREGRGWIINVASVVGLVPEVSMSVSGATKAFAIFLSRGIAFELGPKGVYVQAVLPTTRTELWECAGADPAALPPMMDANDLVDAALAGFDAHEAVTIPALPDAAVWEACQAARHLMLPDFGNTQSAARYRA